MLESVRVMINCSVSDAVKDYSNKIQREIKALRSSFDSKLQSLSEKETRHHIETNMTTKEDLDTILKKIDTFDHLKQQMAEMNLNLEKKINDLEISQSDIQASLMEKFATLEVIEERHHTTTLGKINDLENCERALAQQNQENLEKTEHWEKKILEIESSMARHTEVINTMEEKIKCLITFLVT